MFGDPEITGQPAIIDQEIWLEYKDPVDNVFVLRRTGKITIKQCLYDAVRSSACYDNALYGCDTNIVKTFVQYEAPTTWSYDLITFTVQGSGCP